MPHPFFFFFKSSSFPQIVFKKSCINLQTRGIQPCLIHFQERGSPSSSFHKKPRFHIKSCIHFQTRGIRLCLISANSIRANQDKFELVLQDLIRWILYLSHLKFPHDQKFPMTKNFSMPKTTCPKKKNSHDQNHMSKKFPCAQKSQCPTTKNQCPHQILPQPKLLTCPYTTTNFFPITMLSKKFPHGHVHV